MFPAGGDSMPTWMAATDPRGFRLLAGQLTGLFGRPGPASHVGSRGVVVPKVLWQSDARKPISENRGRMVGEDEGPAMVLHFSRVSAMLVGFRLHPVRRVRTPCRRFVVGV